MIQQKSKVKSLKTETSEVDSKQVALEAILDKIKKNYGEGTAFKLGQDSLNNIEVTPTGSLALDMALGVGGYPKGRIIEIYGPESSGKTTLALKAIAECQKLGGKIVFIDAEHAIDINYAHSLGCNVSDFILCQPDSGEQALEITEMFLRSGTVDMIVIDSVAALTPKAEIEAPMSANHMGLQARMMSQALRKITSLLSKNGTTILFINQLRMKIGVLFGNPETTSGGNALKFFATMRLDVRKAEVIKDKDDKIIGHTIRIKVVKNKVAPPLRMANYDLYYYDLANPIHEVAHMACELSVISRAGSWFIFQEHKFCGKDNLVLGLKENKELFHEILKITKEKAKTSNHIEIVE